MGCSLFFFSPFTTLPINSPASFTTSIGWLSIKPTSKLGRANKPNFLKVSLKSSLAAWVLCSSFFFTSSPREEYSIWMANRARGVFK